MTDIQLQVIGHFLAYHKSNLDYIVTFQQYKNGFIDAGRYLNHDKGFYRFLKDYKVIRNIRQGTGSVLLDFTGERINQPNLTVDNFALGVAELNISPFTNLISLSSKIMMLNDPWGVFPYDGMARKSLRLKKSTYERYYTVVDQNRELILNQYHTAAEIIQPLIELIERQFLTVLPNIEVIRRNRLVDKHLWLSGIRGLDMLGGTLHG